MDKAKADNLFMVFKDFVPEDKMFYLREILEDAPDEKYDMLMVIPLKKPMVNLLLSIFLGYLGIDRFYIGNIGMGVAKILLSVVTCGIFTLIDIYFSYKKCKEINMETIALNVR